MAAISFPLEIGDTCYVNYPYPDSLYFDVQTRVISEIKFTGADEVGVISFTSGNSVTYSDASKTVFATAAEAASVQVANVITRSAANVVLDTTTSEVSTAGNTSTTLGLIG